MPIGCRIAAVHRLGPVESGIALRNKVTVKVRDVAVGICEDRIVRRVRVQLHNLLERFVIRCFGARVRLRQSLQRFLHQTYAHPFAFLRMDDGSVLSAIDGEGLRCHSAVGLVGNLDHGRGDGTLFVAVLVVELIAPLHDCFEILVDSVNGARRMHPTAMLVKSLVNKKLAPGRCAVGIQPFVARYLQL